jgi:polysaccharide export outer membrane protein
MRTSFIKIASGLFLIFGFLAINSAAQEKQVAAPKTGEATTVTVEKPATDEQSAAAIPTRPQDNTRRYRVGIGDELSVEIVGHPEYSASSLKISENGMVSMRRVPPLNAICKTENELTVEFTELYKKIFRQPFVRVRILSYQSQPVAVIGAVDKPGQFNLNRKMRLLEAVAIAGGPTKEAGARISLARLGSADVCENTANAPEGEQDMSKLLFAYNLKQTLEGDSAANPWMQPGDVVTILEADKAFVIGNVKEAKPISLKERRTVTQAIAEAGGILPATKRKAVILTRQDAAGNKTQIQIDLLAISEKKAEDPVLQPNDIIDVPLNGSAQMRSNIIKGFTGGLSSLPFLRF